MGFLLVGIDKELFEITWEGWQIPGAVKPENRQEIRIAASIERKIYARSTESSADTMLVCPSCRSKHKIETLEIDNSWRITTRRVLKDGTEPIFLEDSHFAFFTKVISKLQPLQQRIQLFDRLWETLDDIEKNWKGDEMEMRAKYAASNQPPALAPEVMPAPVAKEAAQA